MSASTPEVIWRPAPNVVGKMPMDMYRRHINRKFSRSLQTTQELHAWSVANQQPFLLDLYSYLNLIPTLPAGMTRAYDESIPISSIPPFFEGLELNYAENVLENAKHHPKNVALIGLREGQDLDGPVEKVTWRALKERVRNASNALRSSSVAKGDVVAALVSNSIEAVVLFLSTAAVGAIFTSISPDLGVEGCVSRLRQVKPKILFADSDATYKGRQTPLQPKITNIIAQLERKPKIVMIPVSTNSAASSNFPSMQDFLSLSGKLDRLSYERVPFTYPLVICYSSGTTGPPKCIVHQHGLILNLKKISMLHNSLGPTDIVMQFSSTTWVLFYIMNGHLATGATTICYDGSPMWPDVRQLIRILAKFKATYFGTSPRYLLELEKSSVSPVHEFAGLPSLRMVNAPWFCTTLISVPAVNPILRNKLTVNTTGATLSPAQYRYFYTAFPPNAHLSNSAGGTDTATSLIAADPCGSLHVGEMQIQALGIDVDVLDPETGASIKASGLPGEMAVRNPFPSMPTCFWGDSDNKLYHASYFERFDNVDVWAQHDWISFNPATGGSVMHGRSDGVLNPSGIRFGSGEIYAIVEGPAFNAEVAEALCVGRRRALDTDESVFLFVKIGAGHAFTEGLVRRLRDAIRKGLSPRHVPRFIVQVDEVPVTINGKKVETAVKQIISGRDIRVSSTVANPECLRGYRRWVGYEGKREAKL